MRLGALQAQRGPGFLLRCRQHHDHCNRRAVAKAIRHYSSNKAAQYLASIIQHLQNKWNSDRISKCLLRLTARVCVCLVVCSRQACVPR